MADDDTATEEEAMIPRVVRFPPDLERQLAARAGTEDRSFAGVVRVACRAYLEAPNA